MPSVNVAVDPKIRMVTWRSRCSVNARGIATVCKGAFTMRIDNRKPATSSYVPKPPGDIGTIIDAKAEIEAVIVSAIGKL